MHLSHFYFSVGGESFDAESFSKVAAIDGARVFKTETVKRLTSGIGEDHHIKILSGVTGTAGNNFVTWQSPKISYIASREDYLNVSNLGMRDHAVLWLKEEAVVMRFLVEIGPVVQRARNFESGELFLC